MYVQSVSHNTRVSHIAIFAVVTLKTVFLT